MRIILGIADGTWKVPATVDYWRADGTWKVPATVNHWRAYGTWKVPATFRRGSHQAVG
jgi:hypothetical protein